MLALATAAAEHAGATICGAVGKRATLEELACAVGERGEGEREELLVRNDDETLLELRRDGRNEYIVACTRATARRASCRKSL